MIIFVDTTFCLFFHFIVQEAYILPHVDGDLKELFFALETKFQPLTLGKKVDAVLDSLKSNEDLSQYIEPLHQITILRTLKQVCVFCAIWYEIYL